MKASRHEGMFSRSEYIAKAWPVGMRGSADRFYAGSFLNGS
jgi:hypothetical protein